MENVANIIGLLERDALDLPKHYTLGDYEENLAKWLSAFLEQVENLTPENSISREIITASPEIHMVCDVLRDTVSLYLRGDLHIAYEKFQKALEVLAPWLQKIIYPISELASEFVRCEQNPTIQFRGHLYRARPMGSDPLATLNLDDIFHMPFDLRHKVSSQRYSVPGLPCLYLGGSLWICWEELGRPTFHNLQVSRFAAAPDASVLDLAWRPRVIAHFLRCPQGRELSAEFVVGQIMCWPLLASCSVKRRYRGLDAPFVAEYILPQLLLRSIRDQKLCDGLRYFSTQVTGYVHYPDAGANYVFPVQTKTAAGHCQVLSGKFAFTSPISWSMLQSSDIPPNVGRLFEKWEIPLGDHEYIQYGKTEFAALERKLSGINVRSLNT